jgi:polysaccharide export outer membrane protein
MLNKSTRSDLMAKMILLCVFIAGFSSCVSYKNLKYLNNAKNEEKLRGLPRTGPLYHVKVKDNLYISLITNDVDVNKLFNPAHAGSTQSINNEYQSAANQYVYGYEVDTSGVVNLPMIGKVKVVGLSLVQCEKVIEDTARHFVKEITAKVKLLDNRVTVMGEVKSPGMYYKYGPDFTVLEAIGMAGSTTNYAELDSVIILRPTSYGTETYVLNLKNTASLASDAYFLQPNDVILVQPNKNKNLELRLPIYTLTIAGVSAVLILISIFHN